MGGVREEHGKKKEKESKHLEVKHAVFLGLADIFSQSYLVQSYPSRTVSPPFSLPGYILESHRGCGMEEIP